MGARYLHLLDLRTRDLVEDLEVHIYSLLAVYLIYFTINYVIPLNYEIWL